MTPPNRRNSPEAPDITPLLLFIIGAFLGSGAVPDESSWIIVSLGGFAGAALFFVVGLYIRDGMRRAGTWNPYADGWKAFATVVAVAIPFVILGIFASLFVEAVARVDGAWLVSSFSTLGWAAGGLYLGRALKIGERTPPGAFINLSSLIFGLTIAGLLLAGWITGGWAGNEDAVMAGGLVGVAVAFVVWLVLLRNRGRRV